MVSDLLEQVGNGNQLVKASGSWYYCNALLIGLPKV